MSESNHSLTDTEKKMIAIAYEEGHRLGEKLAAAIQSGELEIPRIKGIEVLIDKFGDFDIPRHQKFIVKILAPESGIINIGCGIGGWMICYKSGSKFFETKNPIARTCYGISTLCGGTAGIAGWVTGLRNAHGYCGFSYLAAGGDIVGGTFLWIGNQAKKAGDFASGQNSINPFKFRPRSRSFARPTRRHGMGYKGMGFVTNSPIEIPFDAILKNIPYEEIFVIGTTIVTVYTSGKFIFAVYRYINKKFSKKINHSVRIQISARFLINSFKETESIKKELENIEKINRICRAAINSSSPLLVHKF
jgi:hypothetical protein